MSFAGGAPGRKAIESLIAAQDAGLTVADKDWGAAAGLIVRKLLVSGSQTPASLIALREAVGEDIFDGQLKTLSHHQARQLARRIDRSVPDLEVSTARAAIAWIRTALAASPAADETADEPSGETGTFAGPPAEESVATDPATDETVTGATDDETPTSPPASPNPYFGRKSFRTG